MAMFKCKMCGGSLEVTEGATVCECEYCGTQQTVPKSHDDISANLFNRANNLRSKCEFDKAQEIYEKIITQNPTESEAYWGVILCKYGIEYVEDPATFNKIPTCHRTQLESVQTDTDYLSALEYADALQKEVYEREASEIDRLQRDILAIVRNEKPFDVFICYKESDENGKRTQDSVIANDVYHQLTQEGLKVFYSAITLEDKLGQEYEPYIFSALNSAKVMLVIGTKPEYFNAVWVKNEWGRYLKLAKNDHNRLLIPCYRDMDAYDLPEEFSHLQAQDMGKIGFVNDIIRGIKKVISKPEKTSPAKETAVQTGNADTAPLLKRVKLFLEDGDWNSANSYCNRVLDIDPECAEAYYYLLMAKLHIHTDEEFLKSEFENGIENEEYFKKAVRFAGEEDKKRFSKLHTQTIYNFAESTFARAKTESDFLAVKDVYMKIEGYKDAKEKAEKAENASKDVVYQGALEVLENPRSTESELIRASNVFSSIAGWRDSEQKAEECTEKAENASKDAVYQGAVKILQSPDSTTKELMNAMRDFKSIADWKDSEQRIKECEESIRKAEIYETASAYTYNSIESLENSAKLFDSISDWRDSKTQAQKCRSLIEECKKHLREKRKKNFIIVCCCIAVFLGSMGSLGLRYLRDKTESDASAQNVAEQQAQKSKEEADIRIMKRKEFETYPEEKKVWLSAGNTYIIGLKANGTVLSTKNGDFSDWRYIVAVEAGANHAVGLKYDGTVVATGDNVYGQCDVSGWKDIVAVSAGDYHTVGLKSDGTVVATVATGSVGYNQCDVSDWKDIVAVSAGGYHTAGLKSDGTVIATGRNNDGQCNVSEWTDIVAVSTRDTHTVGLKSDGTVVATGNNEDGQCNVSEWTDIVAISAGSDYTVGLKSDGTVVATGYNMNGQCNVSDWTNIVAVSAGDEYTVGLKSDGTVVTTGDGLDVSGWTDIGPKKK